MPPGAQDFLRRACSIATQYDREGSTVLPVRVWGAILDELNLKEDSEGAYFLMDFVQAAGEGQFTYEPMLEAIGESLYTGDDDHPTQTRPDNGRPELDDSTPPPSRRGDQGQGRVPLDLFAEREMPPAYQGGHSGQASSRSAGGYPSQAPASRQGRPERELDSAYGTGLATFDTESQGRRRNVAEVVDETFWARRGAMIQSLFYQWDCNRLTNDSFRAQLQDLFAESVDISHPESEFIRLTNKHTTGRTMKFAMLMSGLRRDAQNTTARNSGLSYLPPGTPSVAGSVYEASECGSDVGSQAAGRPSGGATFVKQNRGARRHFELVAPNPIVPREGYGMQPPRAPLGMLSEEFPEEFPEDMPRYQPPRIDSLGGGSAQGGGGSARGGGSNGDRPVTAPSVSDFWSRGDPPSARQQRPPSAIDNSDAFSVACSEATSVADSQRSAFSMRNRTGHGNILTWGSENSRDLTPPKARQGKQMMMDQGVLRSHSSSGIFSARQ